MSQLGSSLADRRLHPAGLIALAMLCALILAAVPTRGSSGEESRVREVFVSYKEALVRGDGEAAAALVDRATESYFSELKELAVSGEEQVVRQRPFVDRLLIVSMRQILSPEELGTLSLGELMNRAVSEGWISPQTVAQLDIGTVTVDGDHAIAEALSLNPAVSFQNSASGEDPSDDSAVRYQFVREGGSWKFGFASLVENLNRMVEEFTAQLGTDQDELIFVLVQTLTGKPVLPEVWNTPTSNQ